MAQKSALNALTTAFYDALNVAAVTSTLGCGVYDHVPQGAPLPYVRIGSATETRLDTMGKAGKDCTLQVHIFTSDQTYEGSASATTILSKVIELLHYVALTIAGHDLIVCQYETGSDAGDDDVVGRQVTHFVAMFRVWVMEP